MDDRYLLRRLAKAKDQAEAKAIMRAIKRIDELKASDPADVPA